MRKPCQYPVTLETGIAVKTKGSDFSFFFVDNRTLHNLFVCVIINQFTMRGICLNMEVCLQIIMRIVSEKK